MSAEFFNAAIPEPVAILGVRLRPFSLGHVLLLNRFGNAFGNGAAPGLDDLIQAIVICSQKYADALADMDNPKLPEIVAAWQRRLAPRNALGFRRPGLGFSPAAEVGRFTEYVRAGSSFPLFTVKENHQGDPMGVPMVQSVKVLLQSKMGFNEAEVLDRPWGLCLWDYFTLNAMEGHCKIMDRAEYQGARANADKNHDRLVAMMGKN
jgi:hypothetical protein